MTLLHGDIVKTQGSSTFPLVLHHGIVLQEGNQTSIMHNTPDAGGTIIEPLEQFQQSRRIVSVSRSWLNNTTTEQLLQRYNRASGRFDLISYNCEHFCERMLGHEVTSYQLIFWVCMIIIGIVYMMYLFIRG